MMSEHDLRQALAGSDGAPMRALEASAIVRRGQRRRRTRQSAAAAATLGVAGIVTLTGVAFSSSPTSRRVATGTGAAGAAAGPSGVAVLSPLPAASPVAAPATVAAVASSSQAAAPSSKPSAPAASTPPGPFPPPENSVVTDVPLDGGKVAYTLRKEPVFEGQTSIVLDVAGADGLLTERLDSHVSTNAAHASWTIDDDPAGSTHWIMYGVVPAGSTDVRVTLYGHEVPATALTKVPGARSLAFFLSGNWHGQPDSGIGLTLLTFHDAHGGLVTVDPLRQTGGLG